MPISQACPGLGGSVAFEDARIRQHQLPRMIFADSPVDVRRSSRQEGSVGVGTVWPFHQLLAPWEEGEFILVLSAWWGGRRPRIGGLFLLLIRGDAAKDTCVERTRG